MTEAGSALPAQDPDGFYRLRGDALFTGWLTGVRAGVDTDDEQPVPPLLVLERVILPALAKPPCLVAFSGGVDSSALLAFTVDLARRHGLEDPIAITRVYGSLDDEEEQACQRAVIERVALREWIRVPALTNQDLLGPFAASRLERYGLLFPVGAHAGAMLYKHARGGSLLTGQGGDEVLGGHRSSDLRWVLAHPRPLRRAVSAGGLCVAPMPLRRRLIRDHLAASLPWLEPRMARHVVRRLADETAREPFEWAKAKRHLLRLEGLEAGLHNLRALAAAADVRLVDPLLDGPFIRAVASTGGRWGFPDGRRHLVRMLFGHLLPGQVLTRRTKATFNGAFVGPHSRAFARSWDGRGIEHEGLDVERLRGAWLSDEAPAQSLPLLQAAWLATHNIPATGHRAAGVQAA